MYINGTYLVQYYVNGGLFLDLFIDFSCMH